MCYFPPATHLASYKKDLFKQLLCYSISTTAFLRQSSNFLAFGFLSITFMGVFTQKKEERITKLRTHLTAVFICTKFAQRHLSLDSPHCTLFVWKPIRLGRDFNGDLWSLGQHVLQLLSQLIFQLGGQLIWTVWMITCVPLLSIWHREVLRAEGWVGLAATDAAVRSTNQESRSAFSLYHSTSDCREFPGCCAWLFCYTWPWQTPLLVPVQPRVSFSPGAHCQPEHLQLLSWQVSTRALTAQSRNELESQHSVTVQTSGTMLLTCSKSSPLSEQVSQSNPSQH